MLNNSQNVFKFQKKLDELEQKRQQDVESSVASSLAEKLISDAGKSALNIQVLNILVKFSSSFLLYKSISGLNDQLLTLISRSNKDGARIPKNFTSVPQLETSMMSPHRAYNNFMFEEKRRKPSAFPKDSTFYGRGNNRKMSCKSAIIISIEAEA